MKGQHAGKRTNRSERTEQVKRMRRTLAGVVVGLGLMSVLFCGYGHAALSTNLQISGEATVKFNDTTFGITYMQEMTPEICSQTKVGTEELLTDSRDGQKYWVRKVPNGACWMMQNLSYVITDEAISNREINSKTTDLRAAESGLYEREQNEDGTYTYYWTNKSSYPPHATEVIADGGSVTKRSNDQRGTYSWFFGKRRWTGQGYDDLYVMDPLYLTACNNTTNLWNCTNFGRVGSPAGYWDTGEWSYVKEGTVSSGGTGRIYDTHFNVGVYYQFNTVTAGSASNMTSQNMPSSLCPKGWRLPLGSSSDNSSRYSLYNLLTTYGYSTSQNGTYNGRTRNVSQDPIYLVRSGYILASATNAVQYARTRGYLWTAYGGTSAQGVYARVSGTSLTRRSNDSRYYGLPARCVAR